MWSSLDLELLVGLLWIEVLLGRLRWTQVHRIYIRFFKEGIYFGGVITRLSVYRPSLLLTKVFLEFFYVYTPSRRNFIGRRSQVRLQSTSMLSFSDMEPLEGLYE